jgi:hypothetical protein
MMSNELNDLKKLEACKLALSKDLETFKAKLSKDVEKFKAGLAAEIETGKAESIRLTAPGQSRLLHFSAIPSGLLENRPQTTKCPALPLEFLPSVSVWACLPQCSRFQPIPAS